MFSLSKVTVLSLCKNYPKFCVTQLSVHYDFSEKIVNERLSGSVIQEKKVPLPKYVHNFYLPMPMGSKKKSFSARTACEHRNKLKPIVINSKECLVRKNFQDQDILVKTLQQKLTEIQIKNNTHVDVNFCSSDVKMSSNDKKKESKKPNLELISYLLTQDLNDMFMKRQDWSFYHKDVVLQDNIRGAQVVGLEKYMLYINLFRLFAHMRFVYVRMSLLSVTKDEEEGCIKIRWSVVGLGFLRFCLRYLPDKLWEKGSMERSSPTYLDGYSTFYVDNDNKIYHHTIDSVRKGQDEEKVKSPVQKIVELVNKQQRVSQPAL